MSSDQVGISRVLIVGDSNCLPRRGISKYRETWIGLLKERLRTTDVAVLADQSRTTDYLALYPIATKDGAIDYDPISLEAFEPDMVIVNLGIVDCAPRLFAKHEAFILSKLPRLLAETVVWMAKRLRRRTHSRAYVSIGRFRENIGQYIRRCEQMQLKKLVFIAIPTPDKRCLDKSPSMLDSIRAYNAVFHEMARNHLWIDVADCLHPEAAISMLYVEDGYHLSVAGHMEVFKCVARSLKTEIRCQY